MFTNDNHSILPFYGGLSLMANPAPDIPKKTVIIANPISVDAYIQYTSLVTSYHYNHPVLIAIPSMYVWLLYILLNPIKSAFP